MIYPDEFEQSECTPHVSPVDLTLDEQQRLQYEGVQAVSARLQTSGPTQVVLNNEVDIVIRP